MTTRKVDPEFRPEAIARRLLQYLVAHADADTSKVDEYRVRWVVLAATKFLADPMAAAKVLPLLKRHSDFVKQRQERDPVILGAEKAIEDALRDAPKPKPRSKAKTRRSKR